MDSTDGMTRGDEVVDTGNQIQVPVGPKTLGRIMNVIGDPVDERGPIDASEKWSIHRDAPERLYVLTIFLKHLLALFHQQGRQSHS